MKIGKLDSFLNSKPLYYKEINHKRAHIAYDILKPHIKRPKTIHVVGTNGKGSTGRMIAHLAWQQGYNVGHYTSPHILRFNERIWLDGKDISDKVLESVHQRLYDILGKEISETLSYFEYTTLLAFIVFEKCDMMVLEAGLGGEFDATNVCDKELSVITPIGIDHQVFLGSTIEEIATTKMRSIQKSALLAPQPYPEVVEAAKQIASDIGATLVVAQEFIGNIKTEGTHKGYFYDVLQKIAKLKGWPNFLMQNAIVAMQALDIMKIPYDPKELESLELFGRFYSVADNVHIDVGHNPLAAHAIAEAMESETVLIYNSLDDKDYHEVLSILKPKIKRVEILPVDSQRAITLEKIEQALDRVGLEHGYFDGTIDNSEHYLVFGSFYTVEAFLKAVDFWMSEELGIRN